MLGAAVKAYNEPSNNGKVLAKACQGLRCVGSEEADYRSSGFKLPKRDCHSSRVLYGPCTGHFNRSQVASGFYLGSLRADGLIEGFS